jgi:hypothetical protein
MRIFRTLKIGISNLWAWLPIIWKDRDWDSWFIYQIIEFKLRRQSNYIGRKDRHTRAQEDAKDMLICADLINKVKDSYYDSEYTDYHESEMVFTDIEDKPGYSEININTISEDFDSYFRKFPTWHKRAIIFIKENQKRFTTDHNDKKLVAMIMGDLRQEKAKDLVFRIMSKKINRWWD